MPARKSLDADFSVKPAAPKANPAMPGKAVRKLEDVALEVRRLREEDGLDLQQIGEKLQVSYDVLNQLILQSYKSTMNTPVVFEVQEKIRLGLEG
jgi:ribosome-binding protein aMBF1 (putative translation factor)